MKRILAVALLLLSINLTGCFKQDWSLCGIDDNCVLSFRAIEGSVDLFADDINSVDVALYDADDLLIEHRRLEKADLQSERGTKFTVEPGNYKVICWANVSAHSQMDPLTKGTTLFGAGNLRTVSAETGSKLYYAPSRSVETRGGSTRAVDMSIYEITVPPQTQVTKDLDFVRAHRTVNVYIKGYDDTVGGTSHDPRVEITNLPTEYDFLLKVGLTRAQFSQIASEVSTPEGQMLLASFHAPYYDIDNTPANTQNINIFKTSDNSQAFTTTLKAYIDRYSLTNLDVINLLVAFDLSDASVTITIPSWDPAYVEPEW